MNSRKKSNNLRNKLKKKNRGKPKLAKKWKTFHSKRIERSKSKKHLSKKQKTNNKS